MLIWYVGGFIFFFFHKMIYAYCQLSMSATYLVRKKACETWRKYNKAPTKNQSYTIRTCLHANAKSFHVEEHSILRTYNILSSSLYPLPRILLELNFLLLLRKSYHILSATKRVGTKCAHRINAFCIPFFMILYFICRC